MSKNNAKEAMGRFFNKVLITLENADAQDMKNKVLALQKTFNSMVDTGKAEITILSDLEERACFLTDEYKRYSTESDMQKIWFIFFKMLKVLVFKSKLYDVIEQPDESEVNIEDVKRAIKFTLKKYRLELKNAFEIEKLDRFDKLKKYINIAISDKSSFDSKKNNSVHAFNEMEDKFWRDDEEILFLYECLKFFNMLSINAMISKFLGDLPEADI